MGAGGARFCFSFARRVAGIDQESNPFGYHTSLMHLEAAPKRRGKISGARGGRMGGRGGGDRKTDWSALP